MLHIYCDGPCCYASGEERPRLGRAWFNREVEAAQDNRYWGVARLDEDVQVAVNPEQLNGRIAVHLAATGTCHNVPFDHWREWLQRDWSRECEHELERQALAALLPSLRRE